MREIVEQAGKWCRIAFRTLRRGRLPCAERWRRYIGGVGSRPSSRRQERPDVADQIRRVPRLVDDEWPRWRQAQSEAKSEQRRD